MHGIYLVYKALMNHWSEESGNLLQMDFPTKMDFCTVTANSRGAVRLFQPL